MTRESATLSFFCCVVISHTLRQITYMSLFLLILVKPGVRAESVSLPQLLSQDER